MMEVFSMRTKRGWIVVSLLLLAVGSSLGQGIIPPNPKVVGEPVIREPGKQGGQLRWVDENPGTLNPYVSLSNTIFDLMHAGLLEINPVTYALEPGVAESFQFEPDGKALRLVLRDIKFSDGTPLTAEDVLFTINDVLLNTDITSDELNFLREALTIEGQLVLQRAEKLDARTVRLILTQPYMPLLKWLEELEILPRHKLADKVKKLNPNAVPDAFVRAWSLDTKPEEFAGLGPFRLKEIHKTGIPFINEERILVFERNPFYWKVDKKNTQLPYVDTVSVTLVNLLAGAAKFAAGELDYAFLFTDFIPLKMVQDFAELAKKVGFPAIYQGPSFRTVLLTFNQDVGDEALRRLFRDVRFRQAIAHAMNREQIVTEAVKGFGVAQETFLRPSSPFFEPTANRRFEFNLARAQALLDELGLKDANRDGIRELPNGKPLRIELIVRNDDEGRLNTAKLLADSLLKAGIQVMVRPLPKDQAARRIISEPDFQAALTAFTIFPAPAIFPEDFFSLFFSKGRNHFYKRRSDAEGKDVPGYQRRLDQILLQQAAELDPQKRQALFAEMQQLVSENLPVIWLYSPALYVAARPTLGNTIAITTPDAVLKLLETLWRKDP